MTGDLVIHMPSDIQHPSTFQLETHSPSSIHQSRIIDLTVVVASSHRSQHAESPRLKPRWKTREFALYYLVFLTVVPVMFWVPVQLSSPSHQNYSKYRSRLSPGWLFGREVDNSDAQYRSFRNNIFTLAFVAGAYFIVKYAYSRFATRTSSSSSSSDRLHLVPFIAVFAVAMLFGLHGTSAFKILLLVAANYWISRLSAEYRLAPVLIWAFNIITMFLNELYDGYRFASISSSLDFLDSMQGVYPHWHVCYNITMLRLVSFGMDFHWALTRPPSPGLNPSKITEKQRSSISHPQHIYSFINYLAYALYPPLYIAGPIVAFNDFLWQLRQQNTLSARSIFMYFVRFIFCFLTMEFILHYMYMVAIKDTKAWLGYSPGELSMVGFWNLIIVWLKLLIPWRFFRLWALVDGIDPPENMVRCMANNYSTFGFWRSWHRSFNLWIVRYIYIPLGGTKNILFASLLIFTFVALWHDLSFRLLAWGWLVSFFFIPELAARAVLPTSKYGDRSWYRHACAAGAVFNIMMMLSANLIGFVIGTEGMSYMLSQLTENWKGLYFLFGACLCLFVGAQVMFEYREEEMRAGVYRKC